MSRSKARVLEVVTFLVAVATMSTILGRPVSGHFYFRQAHVMANIEKYIEHGSSLQPETYNKDVPYSLFDFPAYELLVASISKFAGGDPLLLARLLSLLCFAATLVLIDRLLSATGLRPAFTFTVVLLFAASPLCLFYFVAPLVDTLAIPLSIASIYAFVRYRQASEGSRWYWVLLATGVLATLIKNPVYLPAFCAIVLFAIGTSRRWFLPRPDLLGFAFAILATVIVFKLYSNRVNGVAPFLSPSETSAYFGAISDRWDPRSWERILRVEREEMLNSVTWFLALSGLALYAWRARSPYKSLYLGLVGGAVAALLVFFSRYTWHDYYQLPLELPLAFCAAFALESVDEAAGVLRRRLPRLGAVTALLVPGILAASLYEGVIGFRRVASTPTDWIQRNGEWIRNETASSDFIVYVMDTKDRRDWNPVFLYFAKRDGYNLSRKRVNDRVLMSIRKRFGADYGRLLLFCPAELRGELDARIEAFGAILIDRDEPGDLYRLDAP